MAPTRQRLRIPSAWTVVTWLMGVAGVMPAIWLWAAGTVPGDGRGGDPEVPARERSDRHLKTAPPRQPKGLTLVKVAWNYQCSECHRSLEPRWHYDRPMVEHEKLLFNHGNNRFCLNCHHPKNRDVFVDDDGSEIRAEDSVRLCARCHGTVHRDWTHGVHGRQNGFWESRRGGRTRLLCIECHDPHDPKFKGMPALRGPSYPARAAGGSVSGSVRDGKGRGGH